MIQRLSLLSLVVCSFVLFTSRLASAQEEAPAAAPAAAPDTATPEGQAATPATAPGDDAATPGHKCKHCKKGDGDKGEHHGCKCGKHGDKGEGQEEGEEGEHHGCKRGEQGEEGEGHGCKRGEGGCCGPKWSLGAGIGYYASSSALWGSLGSTGYGSLSSTAPSYGLSAERRLGEGLWLTFTGSLQHNRGDVPVAGVTGTQTTVQRYTTGTNLALGVRWIFIDSVVDVSVYGKLGGTYSRLSGDARDSGGGLVLGAAPRSYAYAIGGVAGLALERKLLKQLSVRVSADVLEAYWTAARVRTIINATDMVVTKPRGMSAGVTLQPSLELRLYF